MEIKKGRSFWIFCLIWSFCKGKEPVQIVQVSTVGRSECTTWGNFHFHTFDHAKFTFPGTCTYVFASHCNDSYQDFNIKIKRSDKNSHLIYFTVTTDGVILEVKETGITVNGNQIPLPFSLKSVLIEDTCTYFQVTSKLGLTLKWNWADTLLVLWQDCNGKCNCYKQLDLEETYKEKICGLCGNYDGNKKNDLILDGYKMHPRQFGNFHKVEDPSEKCPDVRPDDHTGRHPTEDDSRCSKYKKMCKKLLSRFGNCPKVVAFDDYVATCTEDMCNCVVNSSHSDLVSSCICSTLNQYSRDCVLSKGDPGEWRTKELCYQECPSNMEYMECGNSCADTCADPERSKICKAPCTDGCFCPPGTILDDLGGKKCVPRDSCPCMFQGKVYSSGGTYSTPCQNCTCKGGHWSCISLPCSGSCSIDGGFHITTFDNKRFSFHGNCHYVLAKNTDDTFVVIGEIIQCGTSKTMTCLKNVLVTLGRTTIKICSCGNIYMNNFIVKLPVSKVLSEQPPSIYSLIPAPPSEEPDPAHYKVTDLDGYSLGLPGGFLFYPECADGITIFRPSTFFIKILSSAGVQLQVQMKPVMQLSITVDHSYQNRTSGLCGNFNNIQTDDFRTATGAVEDSAAAFGNSWKTRASCFDVEDSFEDPCSNSVDKEKFAQYWCALLSNTSSTFAACHSVVDPSVYIKRCMYDTCNADKSEAALCSVLSTYSRDCAAAGMTLKGWRQGICDPSEECPETMVYSYSVKYCNQSCRSLDEADPLCKVQIAPMEGCGCPEGTYLNDEEECVTPDDCPCYYKGKIVQPGNSFQEDKLLCKCIQGRLDCIGETVLVKDCPAPMYYFNCSLAGPGAIGSECQKSCKTQDMHCYATECVSGCMCPDGLVLDGNGGCIPKDQCPCVHGGHFYKPGETIRVDCNTCTCNKRQWNCTDNPCKGTCTVYGNGHYMSFDGEKFDFLGDCDYILAQDFCPNNMNAGTFRIVIQNNACGKSLSICSLKITLIFESSEIRLLEGRIQEIATDPGAEKNYKVDLRGGYIVIETTQGMSFMWDQKTTVVVHVTPSFQGKVCGLCGDFDGRSRNDFTTRGQSVEMSIQEFGNSWKITSTCSNINMTDLCADQPFKSALGQKHCSIIKSSVFEACHSKVNPIPYYESCVSDFCGCDSVGDCECFCTSVAAYARSCSTAGVCINWRTPAICPVFCDYYNPPDKHEWFYKPCGAPCLKTCRNPQGKCGNILYSLEGCYPECSPDKPYFDEERRECISLHDCTSCNPEEKLCTEDYKDCLCCYSGKTYSLNETIYSQTDGTKCGNAFCGPNGVIIKTFIPCSTPFVPAQEQLMQPVTSTPPLSTVATPCFCSDNGQLIQMGENVSLPMNISGHCAYSICNASCQIELIWAECKVVQTEALETCEPNSEACPPTAAPNATSLVPATMLAPVSDCLGLIPPRKFNESWNFGNCQIATCLGEENNIKLSSITCPPQQLKLCVNGFPFMKHHDETGCCEVFECQCICSGWGNEHYVTFDGTYYHFKENCTYVLVELIQPSSQKFWIHIDNYYCGATDGAICSMSLLIFHSSSLVILTQAKEHGKETNLVLFNDKKIVPDISKNGIRIASSGLYIIVEIPELEVYVSYSRLAFYIKLPFGKYYNSTMGLCGTCTNQKSDDARRRNGEVIESLKEMALDWKVPVSTNRYCNPGISKQAKIENYQHCEPSELCKVIWNLTECHQVVPPQPYYEACVASRCSQQHPSTECHSMQTYAALCGLHGICVDWRRQTKGQCEATCARDQVYKPCGEAKRNTCFSREVVMDTLPSQNNTPVFVEGCYCPDGNILLNEHDGICVSVCGCTAQDGSVKQPREAWEHDCQYCTCDEETFNISCFPRPCAKSPPINCTKEGFVRKIKPRLDDPCCTETVCECDIKTCIINKTACDLGFQPVVAISEDGCCPIFSCIPKGVCVSEGVEFKPGAVVPKSSCEDCVCTDEQDAVTQTNHIQCNPVKCQTTCQQGFRYVEKEGQCCSQCQQVACVANFSFGSVTIEVGKSYKAPYDNCTQYTCTESGGQFSLTSTVKVCLPFEESNCVPGTVDVTSDGCCKACIDLPHKCKRSVKEQYIVHKHCKSAAPVPVPFCEGTCSTYSVYSFENNEMEHKCICCHEKKSHIEKVELVCSEHKTLNFTYVHVDECGCVETKCPRRRT